MACTDSQHIIEVNSQGEEAWNIELAGRPTDAVRLDNGHTLVALQNAHRWSRWMPSGKEVWSLSGVSNPFSVQRLESGNTLVACTGVGGVIEFDPARQSGVDL